MTHKSTPTFEPSGFFALRTSLLPFHVLVELCHSLCAAHVEADGLAEALAHDRALLRERLRAIVKRPEVLDALFVASPDLEASLEVWLQRPESERGQKIERSIVKYVSRMAGRATPFGLCAGCSVGRVARETHLELGPMNENRRHSRLDMDYLCALTDALAADPNIRATLTYRPNTSIYRSADSLRYVETRLEPKTRERSYSLENVEVTDYLEATLRRAEKSATPEELTKALTDTIDDVSMEESKEYIDMLIEAQLLVPDLQPVVTGTEAIDDLVDQLRQNTALGNVHAALAENTADLRQIDASGIGADPQAYRKAAQHLEALPAQVSLPRLYQVDMTKASPHATLGRGPVADLLKGVTILHNLSRGSRDDELSRFRTAFLGRYEGREVPLVEALDEELGLGLESLERADETSPLLDGLVFTSSATTPSIPWGKRASKLFRLYSEALSGGRDEISLSQKDLDELVDEGDEPLPLPDAFAVMARLIARSEDAVAAGDYRLLFNGASGPSGARLLGRFCHADPELEELVKEHVEAEEALRPDAVFAEIVHLPEGRIGNILFRPVLRGYEIPFLGRSGGRDEQLIPITDLTVSVVGERIVLHSRRLGGKEVIPRLTSAHNYSFGSLGVYRFLCELQGQRLCSGAGWSWGALRSAPYLPRVTTGRLVLSRAMWNLDEDACKSIGQARGAALFRAAQERRATYRWPRWIVLSDYDNELPVDLDNELSVETFAHMLKNRPDATIAELLPGPEELVARGPEGCYVHELVVPFVRKREPRHSLKLGERRPVDAVHRRFEPWSEWLYAKLYTGSATADRVLTDVVAPVARDAFSESEIDRWFFIRYADPDVHVRVRFHGDPDTLCSTVLPRLRAAASPLIEHGLLRRVQLDTYEREVERYGGTAEVMEISERLFQADSEAVLDIIDALSDDEWSQSRWQLTLAGMNRMLCDLGFDLTERLELVTRVRQGFTGPGTGRDIRVEGPVKKQLSDRFRQERDVLLAMIVPELSGGALELDEQLSAGLICLQRRSERLAPIVADLRAAIGAGRSLLSLDALASSYLHMYANRLLRSSGGAEELVIYDFLNRLYWTLTRRA